MAALRHESLHTTLDVKSFQEPESGRECNVASDTTQYQIGRGYSLQKASINIRETELKRTIRPLGTVQEEDSDSEFASPPETPSYSQQSFPLSHESSHDSTNSTEPTNPSISNDSDEPEDEANFPPSLFSAKFRPQLPPKRISKSSLFSPIRHATSLFNRKRDALSKSRGIPAPPSDATSSGEETDSARSSWSILEDLRRESMDYDDSDTECAIMTDDEEEEDDDDGDGMFEPMSNSKSAWGELWHSLSAFAGIEDR